MEAVSADDACAQNSQLVMAVWNFSCSKPGESEHGTIGRGIKAQRETARIDARASRQVAQNDVCQIQARRDIQIELQRQTGHSGALDRTVDRKSTRLNSSHLGISY